MNERRATGPPGSAERITAKSALVIAPHYDDEVLGCGGLVSQLATRGAAVRVLFLTDGAGGEEAIADAERAAYAALRRQEAAQAAAVLGTLGSDHLALPDGQLERHLGAAAVAIRRVLLALRPELVLVPSPLESTADHRAAFAALHQVLAGLRGGDELDAVAARFEVLAYEVNHPFYPDLLVDVSAELPRIEAAMACYASQEERHPYLGAALGLRRYRALTLGPEVRAAEAYLRLLPRDFATRGLSGLITELGGVPARLEVREGPLVSIIVRTKDRPQLLAEALASLGASTYQRVEVLVVNDGGTTPPLPADFPFPLRLVDLPEDRGRAGAANAGLAAATGDYVGFLDDDDLHEPEHLATLVGAVTAAQVRVAYSDAAVGIYELDPNLGWWCTERRLPYSRDFDPDLLLLDNYIPFNTLLIERALATEVGALDLELPFFEDWDFLIRLSARAPFHHLRQVTCEYRHFRGGAHHVFGERPRQRADFLAMKARVINQHRDRWNAGLFARVADTLRAEAVGHHEEAVTARGELRSAERQRARLEERYHRINGEHQALRQIHQKSDAELVRLYGEERHLRAVVAEQTTAIGGLYAEIDRLNRLAGELGALREHEQRLVAQLGEASAEIARLRGEEAALRLAAAEQAAHLGRTYGEIERLNELVRGMEASRAWRLHSWLERRRGRRGAR